MVGPLRHTTLACGRQHCGYRRGRTEGPTGSEDHPIALVLPALGWLTDPPDEELPGSTLLPRAAAPGYGSSERFVVSPGHESDGIFEMPGGEASNPLSPYYLAGHEDWEKGRPSPFLPGPPRWTLALTPVF